MVSVKSGVKEGIQPTAQECSLSTNSRNMVNVTVTSYVTQLTQHFPKYIDPNVRVKRLVYHFPVYNTIDSTFTSHHNGAYHWLIKHENDESVLYFHMDNNSEKRIYSILS